MKVDFLIAGVQKGGTTSLDAYLRQHPQIAMAEVKEPHFFDNEAEFSGGLVAYENYHQFFRRTDSSLRYGEATPIYTYWPPAMARIRQYNPRIKLIVLLRNPVDRAWSAWRMEKKRGVESLSFSEALRHELSRTEQEAPLPHREFSYVDRGRYGAQIRRVESHFPGNVLFLKSEIFFSQPQPTVNRVLDFLEVLRYPIDTSVIHFEGETEAPPSQADREFILEQLSNDIEETERLLSWDCSDWLRI